MLFLFYFLSYRCVCVCTAPRLLAFIIFYFPPVFWSCKLNLFLFSHAPIFYLYNFIHTKYLLYYIYISLSFEVHIILVFYIIIYFCVSLVHFSIMCTIVICFCCILLSTGLWIMWITLWITFISSASRL